MMSRLLHALVCVLVPTVYRFRAHGLHRVPSQGAAVVVANHVSFIDSLVLGAALDRVPRFVMHAAWLSRLAWARRIFDAVGVIPIAGRREDAQVFARAFDEIDAALARGELVVIFPEGKLTPSGEVEAFRKGVEHILRRRPVPVIPVALRGLWGSMWSMARGRRGAMGRRRVEVVIGRALPPTVDAETLRARVRSLRAHHA